MRSRICLLTAVGAAVLTMNGCSSSSTASPSSAPSVTAASTITASTAAGSGVSSTISVAADGSRATSAAASGCPSSAPAEDFTFSSDGDVNIQNLWQQTLLPAFKKVCPQFAVTFTFDTHSANANLNVAKIAAAEKSGQAPPIDVADNAVAEAAAQAGLTQPLTSGQIPALSEVNPKTLAQYKSSAVPYRASSVLLAYDSTKITDPPKTLKDLLAWIKANPGQFTYNDPSSGGSGNAFAEAVVDSTMTPADLARAQQGYVPALQSQWAPGFATLKELTPSIYQKVYPNGNQAVIDLLSKGEISMAPVWSDQFLSAKSQGQLGDEYKVTQIADPPFTGSPAYIGIIKGSKHAAGGQALIQWLLQPAQQALIVKTIQGFPAIPMAKLPAGVQSAFGDVDVQALRPPMSSKMGADMKSQWAAKVPG